VETTSNLMNTFLTSVNRSSYRASLLLVAW